jgi:hypothetical protein
VAPRSAKALERIPGTLFERDELPTAEVVDGCLRAMLESHARLEDVLKLAEPGFGKGLLLERSLMSCQRVLAAIREARREQINRAWRKK